MASLVPDAIKFRYLINQLTKQEYAQFLNQLIIENKSALITSSIFHYFTQTAHAKIDKDSKDLNDINSILSNIIQSRKNKQKSQPLAKFKLDELPKAIIGYVASNLGQWEYFDFQKTNRSIFIGCNTPNMLTELNLEFIKDYGSINLAHFRSVKRLCFDLTKFNEFILPNNGTFIMNELDNLTLVGNRKNNFDVQSFVDQNCINIKNIKTLGMHDFGEAGPGNRFNADKFYQLVTTIPNAECIYFFNVMLALQQAESGAYVSKLNKSCPKVTSLNVVGGSSWFHNTLLNTFGNNLHSLMHSHNDTNRHIDLSKRHFNKLTQLKLHGSNVKMINDILHTADKIETFVLHPFNTYKITLNGEELKTIIPKVLKCKLLQYLEIEANDTTFDGILTGIEKGLFETMKYERKQMKIRICAESKSNIDITNMILNIGRIIHWLLESNLTDFMLILDMNGINHSIANKYNKDKILNDLNNLSSNVKTACGNGLIFVITNKSCTINGFDIRCEFQPVFVKNN